MIKHTAQKLFRPPLHILPFLLFLDAAFITNTTTKTIHISGFSLKLLCQCISMYIPYSNKTRKSCEYFHAWNGRENKFLLSARKCTEYGIENCELPATLRIAVNKLIDINSENIFYIRKLSMEMSWDCFKQYILIAS